MTNDGLKSPGAPHGSFFRRKRPFLYQKSPPPNDASAGPPIATTEHSSDAARPSTAVSAQSVQPDSVTSSTSNLTDNSSTVVGRSSSMRSPTKARTAYSQLGEAISAGFDRRSTSGSSRQFPPSAFFHRTRASESSVGDVSNRNSQSLSSPTQLSPTTSATSGPVSPLSSRRESNPKLPLTAFGGGGGRNALGRSMTSAHGGGDGGKNNPQALMQRIRTVASKRISTLDYLKQVHQGDVFWFTTFQFRKADLMRLPYFEPRKLARRANNYLILGLSIPQILDPNAESATEYLRAFNQLLGEFEQYHSIHSVDGQTTGSIGKSRFPQIFRRATGVKSRRTSNPGDSHYFGYDPSDPRSGGSYNSAGSTSFSSFTSDQELLPGEEYSFLLTPFLPFEPDYFETFVTLCDVLIDCYTRIISLTGATETIQPGVGDLFNKADAKVRKLLVAGLVQEMDDATKQGIKAELAGVGRVVLGPLMG